MGIVPADKFRFTKAARSIAAALCAIGEIKVKKNIKELVLYKIKHLIK
jgi:hypothetical protein